MTQPITVKLRWIRKQVAIEVEVTRVTVREVSYIGINWPPRFRVKWDMKNGVTTAGVHGSVLSNGLDFCRRPSAWIFPSYIVLKLLNRMLLLGDNPLHQIAD